MDNEVNNLADLNKVKGFKLLHMNVRSILKKMGNFEKNAFKEKILAIGQDWEEFFRLEDPEQAWAYILEKITPVLNEMCPIRKFKIKNYRPEWITLELIEQLKDHDYFFRKAKKENCEDAWNIAKHLRNVTNANLRRAKREFILSELDGCDTDYKKFWNTIKSVIPSNKGDARQEIMLKDKGDKLDRGEVAHYINDYFINVGKIASCGTSADKSTGYDANQTQFSWPQEGLEVGENEVLKLVKDINISKFSGLDNISSFIIKESFTVLITQVTYMYNLSLSASKFPTAWKEALVIPIPKSGNLTQVRNYRPISLLPLPGKLLEKLVHKQLSEHLEENSLITKFQHGFLKSTQQFML